MVRQGKNEEELIQVLAELDEQTAIDSVLTRGQNVTIHCSKFNGKLTNWSIENDPQTSDKLKKLKVKKGHKMVELFDYLNDHIKSESLNSNIVVLCYSHCETNRTWDGKIITQWIVINPSIPFELSSIGSPLFPMLELELDDNEFALAMESKMALYNEYSEDVYPIREVAFSSIGKLLDSAASFKNMARIPLGSALLLAERFATDMKDLKFIYRNAVGKFKPLIGVAGSRFAQDTESDFFKIALDKSMEMFGSGRDVVKWIVSDELSTVYIDVSTTKDNPKFVPYNEFPMILRVQTSDIPGTSASVTMFAKLGKGNILIQRNSAYHWDSFLKKGGSASLFYRTEKGDKTEISLRDDGDVFVEKIHTLMNANVVLDKNLFKLIKDICTLIGKKNSTKNQKEIEAIGHEGDVKNAYNLLVSIIDATFCELPIKQENQLSVLYMDLVNYLTNSIERENTQVV